MDSVMKIILIDRENDNILGSVTIFIKHKGKMPILLQYML